MQCRPTNLVYSRKKLVLSFKRRCIFHMNNNINMSCFSNVAQNRFFTIILVWLYLCYTFLPSGLPLPWIPTSANININITSTASTTTIATNLWLPQEEGETPASTAQPARKTTNSSSSSSSSNNNNRLHTRSDSRSQAERRTGMKTRPFPPVLSDRRSGGSGRRSGPSGTGSPRRRRAGRRSGNLDSLTFTHIYKRKKNVI